MLLELVAFTYNPLVHIPVGPFRLSPHGIGIAVGFLVGARLMVPEALRKGIDEDAVYSLLVRAAVGAIIGARVAYVLNHLSDYGSVVEMLRIWEGGISLLGGIFGAVIAALPRMRRLGLSFWRVMDAAAPGLALGIVIGRIGDLVVADHLGKTTSFFLGYECPPLDIETASPCAPNTPNAIAGRTEGALVHHTALYDLILTLILLFVLLRLRRKVRWDGFLILFFAAWYSVGRVIEDFLREDVRRFGLTGSQITSIIVFLLAVYLLLVRRSTPRFGQWDLQARLGEAAAGADYLDDERDDAEAASATVTPSTAGTSNYGDEAGAQPPGWQHAPPEPPAHSEPASPPSRTWAPGDLDVDAGGDAPWEPTQPPEHEPTQGAERAPDREE